MPEIAPECPQPIDYVDMKSQFDVVGYAGPFTLANDACMADFNLGESDPRFIGGGIHTGWHMFSPSVRAVLNDENLKRNVSALCGDDMVIWRSGYFVKKPTYVGEIGWHHDKQFQGGNGEPLDFDEIRTHFSLLLAMNDMGADNGMLELIPGSHKTIPGLARDSRLLGSSDPDRFIEEMPRELLDKRRSVLLKKGEYIIFHSALLHRSLPFSTGEARRSFVVRLVPKSVAVPAGLFPFYLPVS